MNTETNQAPTNTKTTLGTSREWDMLWDCYIGALESGSPERARAAGAALCAFDSKHGMVSMPAYAHFARKA